jgi:tetratricopeptide (TPR) repeat protein
MMTNSPLQHFPCFNPSGRKSGGVMSRTAYAIGVAAVLLVNAPSVMTQTSQARSAPQSTVNTATRGDEGAVMLSVGKPVERELKGGMQQSFQVSLSAGQFVRLVVAEKGIDVAASLFDPAGRKLREETSMSTIEGEAKIFWVAETGGVYRLSVGATQPDARPGSYVAKVTELRAGVPHDKELVAAEDALAAGAKSLAGGTQESLTDAYAEFDKALSLLRAAGDRKRAAYALRRKAMSLVMQGRPQDALPLEREALQLTESEYGLNSLKVAPALWDLADVVARMGQLSDARGMHERAMKIIEAATGADSLQAALGLSYKTNLLVAQGYDGEALDASRRVLSIYERRYGPDSANYAYAAAAVARILQRQGNLAEARRQYERVLKIYSGRFGEDAPELLATIFSLSQVLLSDGDGSQGVAMHVRGLRIIERVYGARSPQAAQAYWEKGNMFMYLRRAADARAAYMHSLEISPKVSPAAINAHIGIANTLRAEDDYAGARARYEEAVRVSEQLGGPDSPGVAYCLAAKASAYPDAGDYAEGAKLYERSVGIYEKTYGADSIPVADMLAGSADYDEDHRKYQGARSKYKRAMNIYETKDAASLRAAFFLKKVGDTLVSENRIDEALAALRDGIAKYEKVYGPSHPALLGPLKSLAEAYAQQNRLEDVRGVLQRSLQILKDNNLSENLFATDVLQGIASLNHAEGRFAAARDVAGAGVKIFEMNQQRADPDDEVQMRNVYGLALLMEGDLPKARVEMEKTIELADSKLGPSAPASLVALTNMATLLSAVNDMEKIKQHVVRVYGLRQALVDSDDPQAIRVFLATALLARQLGMNAEARELLKKASELTAKFAGPDNFIMTDLYTMQAMMLGSLGDYAGAQEAIEKADRLFKQLDPELLTRALLLGTSAQLFVEQDKLPQARAAFEETVRIFEKRLGPQHFIVAQSTGTLAWVYFLQGEVARSRASYLKAAGVMGHHVRNVLPSLSMAEQRLFLDEAIPDQVSGLLATCREGTALRDAYEPMFQWKGSLIDSLRRQTVITRLGRDGSQSAGVKRLQDVRAELAGWYYRFRDVPADDWRKKNDELTEKKERLERELARALKPGELDDPLAAGLAGFQRLLGQDEVFLDVYLYDFWNKDDTTEERYAVVVTGAAGGPSLVDLGPSAKINGAVAAWRDRVLSGKEAAAEWAALATLLWKPLGEALPSGTRKVWVSPDGELARLPWQLLPAESPGGKRLLLTQTDSARELARLRQTKGRAAPAATTIFLAGDIDFNAKLSANAHHVEGEGFRKVDGAEAELASLQAAGRRFKAEVIPLTGAKVSKENVVANIQKATYAHLVTHGFFSRSTAKAMQGGRGIALRTSPLGETPAPDSRNPLVESGIALAGANQRDPLELDVKGLLTAEEIVGLDLSRCELVTLSACETGRGQEVTGQGVMGLRASVMAAGSRAMLMSLWKVPDDATVKFMDAFYDNLWTKKMPKAEALLRAQEAVRDDPTGKYREPFNWAAWVLAGEAW